VPSGTSSISAQPSAPVRAVWPPIVIVVLSPPPSSVVLSDMTIMRVWRRGACGFRGRLVQLDGGAGDRSPVTWLQACTRILPVRSARSWRCSRSPRTSTGSDALTSCSGLPKRST